MGANGPQAGQLFPQSKPDIDANGGLVDASKFEVEMVERAMECPPSSFHSNGTSLHRHSNTIGNGDCLTGEDCLHFGDVC